MKDGSGITLTMVDTPPPVGGRPLGDGHVRASYLRTAHMMAGSPGQWFSLGYFGKNQLDYLRKILRGAGCMVTTRAVNGTNDFHVYSMFTGAVKVPFAGRGSSR